MRWYAWWTASGNGPWKNEDVGFGIGRQASVSVESKICPD